MALIGARFMLSTFRGWKFVACRWLGVLSCVLNCNGNEIFVRICLSYELEINTSIVVLIREEILSNFISLEWAKLNRVKFWRRKNKERLHSVSYACMLTNYLPERKNISLFITRRVKGSGFLDLSSRATSSTDLNWTLHLVCSIPKIS